MTPTADALRVAREIMDGILDFVEQVGHITGPWGKRALILQVLVDLKTGETTDAVDRMTTWVNERLDRVRAEERQRAAGISTRLGRHVDAVVPAILTGQRTGDAADGYAALADTIAAAILADDQTDGGA